MVFRSRPRKSLVADALRRHFGSLEVHELVTAARTFPITSRVDLQHALEQQLGERYRARPIGLHAEFSHETLTFAHLFAAGHYAVQVGPLQHDEVDVGETMAARCLKNGLWLARHGDLTFAVLLTPAQHYGRGEGVHLEVALPPGEAGLEHSRALLDSVETAVSRAGTYRGKVISLEAAADYSGKAGAVKVHRLEPVERAEVILPEKTLALLERNVHQFVEHRAELGRLGLATKKGLLFYGPPGTGKTHTIRYLAGRLHDHTTLLITAEQVGLLEHYFQLARFLQPAMVIIEDVDLIARAREEMRSAVEESLLNKLLNEMDGLREEAAVLFILTTNRPDQLEAALASRPGRIDQAIEFPLPDEEGRRKLVSLYARGAILGGDTVEGIVRRTSRASPAFIKELMRRATQYRLQDGGSGAVAPAHVDAALDEMLWSGGSLNVKLLGGAVESSDAAS